MAMTLCYYILNRPKQFLCIRLIYWIVSLNLCDENDFSLFLKIPKIREFLFMNFKTAIANSQSVKLRNKTVMCVWNNTMTIFTKLSSLRDATLPYIEIHDNQARIGRCPRRRTWQQWWREKGSGREGVSVGSQASPLTHFRSAYNNGKCM